MKYQSDYATIESLKELKDTVDTLQTECQTRLERAQQLQSEAQAIQAQYDSINSIGEFIESIGGRVEFLTLVKTLDQVIEPLKTFQDQNQSLSSSIQDILGLFASLNSVPSSDTVQEHGDSYLDSVEEDTSNPEEVHLLSSLGKLGLTSIVVDVQKELQAAREVSLKLRESRLFLSDKLDSLSADFEELEPRIKDAIKQLTEKSAISESLFQKVEGISRKIESDRHEIESAIQESQGSIDQVRQYCLSAEEAASEAKACNEQVKALQQEIESTIQEGQNNAEQAKQHSLSAAAAALEAKDFNEQVNALQQEIESTIQEGQDNAEQVKHHSLSAEEAVSEAKDCIKQVKALQQEIESTIQEGQNNAEQVKHHSLSAEEAASEAKDFNEQVKTLHQELQSLFLELQKADQKNEELSETLGNNLQESGVKLATVNSYLDMASGIYDQARVVQKKIEQDKDAIERDRQEIMNTSLNLSGMEKDLKDLRTQYNYLDNKNQKLQKRMLYLSGGFALLFLLLLIVAA